MAAANDKKESTGMANSSQTQITGAFFDKPEHMVDKLEREIRRLDEAESGMWDDDALDHAFNAAFIGWHMIDWIRHSDIAPKTPTDKTGLNSYFIASCPQLSELHDITTRLKHITVSSPKSSGDLDVRASIGVVLTPSELIRAEKGEYIRPQNPMISKVKFGESRAKELLDEVHKFWRNYIDRGRQAD